MPALLQAFLRLVALKRLGVLLFVLAATLCASSTASAFEHPQTKTRVRGFVCAEHNSDGLLSAATSGKHRENRSALSEVASDSLLAAEGAEAAVQSIEDIPATMIGQESGPSIVVPEGATGPTPAWNGAGAQYTGGRGGPGLSPRVSGLRIMEPTLPKGPSPGYPSGYGSYFNANGQTVNPLTGQTIARSDAWWHIPLR